MKDPVTYCSSSTSVTVSIYIYCLLVILSLKFAEGFDPVIQLPSSARVNARPRSKRVFIVGEFDAKGNGFQNHTQAFKSAWKDACSSNGRAKVVIPHGKSFQIHPIDLAGPCSSRISLMILGTITAPKDPDAWSGLNKRKWLYFHGVNHLIVDGGGTINGMGKEWWVRSCKTNSSNAKKYFTSVLCQPCQHAPTAITFHRCKDLQVRNLRVVDSQQMHMAFTGCMRVMVSRLTVLAPAWSPNTDGIHISSTKKIEVKESLIGTGDDCISIVGNSSQVLIRNIYCGPGHGISIGSLGKSHSWVQVYDVKVDGVHLHHTSNGVRVKTWQGGNGTASKIAFEHVTMENVSNPIIVDQYYCDSKHPCKNQTSAIKLEDITFMHIHGTSATEEAIRLACSEASPCKSLYLEDIHLVSSYGEEARSFCWEAYGTSWGLVYPPPCFPDCGSFIRQKAWSISAVVSA